MRLQFLKQDIGRDLANDVGHEEDRQRGVIVGACLEIQVCLESQNGRIANIDSAAEVPVRSIGATIAKGCDKLTDPRTRASTIYTSKARDASLSWPSTCARWWMEAEAPPSPSASHSSAGRHSRPVSILQKGKAVRTDLHEAWVSRSSRHARDLYQVAENYT